MRQRRTRLAVETLRDFLHSEPENAAGAQNWAQNWVDMGCANVYVLPINNRSPVCL